MSKSEVNNSDLSYSIFHPGKGMLAPLLVCPHCGFKTEDTWEVLDQGCIDEMRCESCTKMFIFALMECNHCGVEQGYSWLDCPADAVLDRLNCDACGHLYGKHDDAVEAIDTDGF